MKGVEQRTTAGEPRVWRTPTGTGRRHVDIGAIRRRCRAVAEDNGRIVIAPAERDAGNVELGPAMGREVVAGSLSSRAEMVPPPVTPPVILMVPGEMVETLDSTEVISFL